MEQAIALENIDMVKKRISNAGFGNRFDKAIVEALAAGETKISLFTSEIIENTKMDFKPEIRAKETKGYFNGFKATLYKEDGSRIEHWFKASDRITINEAYILMMDQRHPRAVLKTYYDESGKKYSQWIQLDFTQKTKNDNYLTKRYSDYDQVAKLNDYEFVELSSDNQRATAATFMAEGREIELTPVNQQDHKLVYMRANPEWDTFTFLSTDGEPLYHDQFRTEAARQRIQQERNTRESGVSFVKKTGQEHTSGTDSPTQTVSDPVKNNNQDPAGSLRPGNRERVVREGENRMGRSL